MGLLDELTSRLRLDYLSDLRSLKDLSDVKIIIQAIPESRYPLSEWNNAVGYLTKTNEQFPSASRAKEFLLNS